MDHFVFLSIFDCFLVGLMETGGRTLKKTRTDIEKPTVGRTDGRTDAQNFVHRGKRVFVCDDQFSVFGFPFQSRVPLGGHFDFARSGIRTSVRLFSMF